MQTKGTAVYPKGSPKYNLLHANSKKIMKKASPKFRKTSSPVADKSRATWNPALEKSLVELLLEHNTTYHRSQNGWSSETWNQMVSVFQKRNPHVKFTKSQVQDKEKDLKRDYRVLKEARKQSGVGWNEEKSTLQADPHLWVNLVISLGDRIKKFKRKAFPLYDCLGELYDGQLAEGNLCFTSTAGPSAESDDDDLQITDGPEQITDEVEVTERNTSQVEHEEAGVAERKKAQVDVVERKKARVDVVERKKARADAAEWNRSQAGASKKKSADGIVGVMERFVQIKEREVTKEAAQEFTITRCMEALKTLEGITPDEKMLASEVFNNAHNREFFVNLVADKDGTAIIWLRRQLARLT